MKYIIIASVAAVLISCNSGGNVNQTNNTNKDVKAEPASSAEGENIITFKANGAQVNTNALTISRFIFNGSTSVWLNITSDMNADKRAINMNLNGTAAGSYNMVSAGTKESMGTYFPDYSSPANAYLLKSGSVVITNIDTVKNLLNGSFTAEAVNNAGEKISITDGKIINGRLTPGIQNPQAMTQ